ncbi:hypothetical protein HanXRQr2_Chr17g0807691 [Helianthus annuus]|uniref:Uncharacterized protein n=1 Tax=Helianthus annuus TaxID=4232 RepID=A0A9K3DIU3_HELAN|nr:hypothetical protein HanXRQr2_Chr17g0807691 [Helianthus annuus]
MPCYCLLGVEPDMKYGAAANTALSRSSNCGRDQLQRWLEGVEEDDQLKNIK